MNFDHLFETAGKYASAQISAKRSNGEDCTVTFVEFLQEASAVADRLTAAGITKGMQIALQAFNCYEYLLWDLAAIRVGAVLLAIPEDMSPDAIEAIARQQCVALWICERGEDFAAIPNKVVLADSLAKDPLIVDLDAPVLEDDDLHSRVYSSGSSGYLKGLNISRRGSELLVADFIADFELCQSDSHLIFLPLSNYQQRLSVYGCLWSGASFKVARHTSIFQDLGRYKPSFIIAPPAIYENIYNIYGRAGQAKDKLAAFLGGNIRFMITGMAPIRYDVLQAFHEHGVCLLEAYGVTETGMIAWNTMRNQRIGSVGLPIHPEHVHFTSDSEIIVKRPFPLCNGYFDSPESDNAGTFLADGGIATGDIGALDADGYLTLSGRRKEIIVTNGGAKFHPEEIERSLSSVDGVKNAIVLMSKNDGRLVAVVILYSHDDQEAASRIESGVREINASIPSYKSIHRWVLSDIAPSIENGMLTRNLKFDRKGVYLHFRKEIEQQHGH
ncbi:MAG: AMP-binding protein [Lysobacter sp.]|nr:AMP-binding protein [Lysobacter sp.]